ncbi:MAG: type II/IV secretion system protein [Elusimicrobia bacterium]|nr:type II/IV secretion system protein [Elusimicrobiota bacterium]
MALQLYWNRCQGDAWADLFAVDAGHAHFNGLVGIYIVWHGGKTPATVRVGQGLIRDVIRSLREDLAVTVFRDQSLFITWARVDPAQISNVERYLGEVLKPKVPGRLPDVNPVEVNLPTQPLPSGSPSPAPSDQPSQHWQDLVVHAIAPKAIDKANFAPPPPPEPPKPAPEPAQPAPEPSPEPAKPVPEPVMPPREKKILSSLQRRFDDVMASLAKPVSKGLFGAAAPPKVDEERLVLDVVQMILEEAVRNRASDIHIEPFEEEFRVRYRIDGILDPALRMARRLNIRVVSGMRVMCGLDPEQGANTSKPQDGRMMISVDGQEVDLRLSTFPTSYGDKAVIRLIHRSAKVPDFVQLGLRASDIETIGQVAHRPQGMIIVTGPAGSGKSTSIYAVLQGLNDVTRNIVTLEDPIEMKLYGINQGPIHTKTGFTFAEGLRSILRQDPNVIMVGEIRDKETAEIAMSASLTGHLLFSTLHTNSALGAITRFLDMGLEPYLIASALTAVFAQRLARRLCDRCREAYTPSRDILDRIGELAERSGASFDTGKIGQLYRAVGCEACRGSGYNGRVLLFESLVLLPSIRRLILQKVAVQDLQGQAFKDGMITLLADGFIKASTGLTTIEEVVRLVGGEA